MKGELSMAKKRCVAYARVSTNKEDQQNSLQNQKTYFQRELEHNTDVRLVHMNITGLCEDGVYYDEGRSGTKLYRPAFDKMLEDAGLQAVIDADNEEKTTAYKIVRKPKFDYIFVKDTTRFARNVSVDAILKTLAENKVYVRFLDINKTSESNEDMTYIQIFLSFAERESRDKSVKTHFGFAEGARQGRIYADSKLIGYTLDKENNCLIVDEKQAKLVRLIFNLYTEEGLGQQVICNRLADMGYFNSKGNKYCRSTIRRILQNEKYCGENNAGRYAYVGLFSKRTGKLTPYDDPVRQEARKAQEKQLEQGIIKIPAIISKEQFDKAQRITESNRTKYNNNCTYHGTTDYARKIKCGCCGAWYTAGARKYMPSLGMVNRYYSCKHRTTYDEANGIPKCNNPSIKESELDTWLNSNTYYNHRMQSVISLLEMADLAKRRLSQFINADNTKAVENIDNDITAITEKRKRLLALYADGIYSKAELDELTSNYTRQINALREKREQLAKGNEEIEKQIDELNVLCKEGRKEQQELKHILETEEYPKKTRKELLRDVDFITIDTTGKPHITFKSTSAIHETTLMLGQLIENLNDADEAGWEEEMQ